MWERWEKRGNNTKPNALNRLSMNESWYSLYAVMCKEASKEHRKAQEIEKARKRKKDDQERTGVIARVLIGFLFSRFGGRLALMVIGSGDACASYGIFTRRWLVRSFRSLSLDPVSIPSAWWNIEKIGAGKWNEIRRKWESENHWGKRRVCIADKIQPWRRSTTTLIG